MAITNAEVFKKVQILLDVSRDISSHLDLEMLIKLTVRGGPHATSPLPPLIP